MNDLDHNPHVSTISAPLRHFTLYFYVSQRSGIGTKHIRIKGNFAQLSFLSLLC